MCFQSAFPFKVSGRIIYYSSVWWIKNLKDLKGTIIIFGKRVNIDGIERNHEPSDRVK